MRNILIVDLEGTAYGIWEDEVKTIEHLASLHRLPLSPECIAGISIIHGRTVTLADLSVCVGHRHLDKTEESRVLIMSEEGKITGFVIAGEPVRAEVPEEAVLPLPGYLKTPLFDTGVLVDARLLPLINLSVLLERLQKGANEPLPAPLALFPPPADRRRATHVRMVDIAGESFGVYLTEPGTIAHPASITPLRFVPEFIAGVTLYDGEILPVIDLAQRVRLRKSASQEVMLVADAGSGRFGFLIDADRGHFTIDRIEAKTLPPIAQSRWLREAIMQDGDIIPLLDPVELMYPPAEGEETPPVRYAPGSDFSRGFGNEDIEVVEFILLGVRHAVPKMEVEDVIGYRRYRSIPNVPAIMTGVAEHSGDLLPVLDLAAVFGRRSLATPEWRMLVVQNGNFRALVMSEAVFGARRIARSMQRTVPILLPHHVLYGCYPEAEGVRLIMNIEAMAAHFEKALVQEFLPAMSGEMKEAPAVIVPALIGAPEGAVREEATVEETPETQQEPLRPVEAPGAAALAAEEKEEPVAAFSAAGAVVEEKKEIVLTGEPEPPRIPEADSSVPEPEPPAASSEPQSETSAERPTDAAARGDVLEEVAAAEKQQHGPEEGPVPAETIRQAQEEPGPINAAPEREPIGVPEEQAVPAAVAAASAAVEIGKEEKEETTMPSPVPSAPVRDSGEPVSGPEVTILEPAVPKKQVLQGETPLRSGTQPARLSVPQPASQSRTVPVGAIGTERRRRWLISGALGLALAALFYFAWTSITSKREDEMKRPAVMIPSGTSTLPAGTMTLSSVTAALPSPLAAGHYTVREGDTLWKISERLTGDPRNYPRLAGENRIADPDLIFPGQKIVVERHQ